jgi:hypothetical protein
VSLTRSQHGNDVRGVAEVPAAYAGSRLEVDLLVSNASLARAGHASRVRVGRFLRASVASGRVSFSIALDARARRALRLHGRLAVTVRIALTPPGGASVTTTRSTVLHR